MSLINHNQDNTEALSNDSPVITSKIRSHEFKFTIFTFMKIMCKWGSRLIALDKMDKRHLD